MAYKISDECTACGECVGKCPAGAINNNEKGFAIDSDKCTDCGSCAEICPVAAADKC